MAWAGGLWRRTRRIYHGEHYGFAQNRCKDQAMVLVKVVRWRLRKQGDGALSVFSDQSNAFPSVAWERLGVVTQQGIAEADRGLMCGRPQYTLAL